LSVIGFKATILKILIIYQKIFNVFINRNRLNKNKEKLLRLYSFVLFRKSIKILVTISMILIIIYLISYFDKFLIEHIMSVIGIFESILVIVFCFYIKSFFNDKL
tara:strand:- start:104 stop:418 length:315 start_codon:yes stop_codon:yes gene_type:complete